MLTNAPVAAETANICTVPNGKREFVLVDEVACGLFVIGGQSQDPGTGVLQSPLSLLEAPKLSVAERTPRAAIEENDTDVAVEGT